MDKSPILVTGMHRSGTTFTGRVLDLASNVIYLQEPLNKDHGCKGVPCWYPYPESNDGNITKALIPKILSFNFSYNSMCANGASNYKKMLKKLFGGKLDLYLKYFKLRSLLPISKNTRILVKDPQALLMSEWMYNKYDMKIIVLIRHPAAVYYSIKRLGWRFDFENLLKQKEYIERFGFDLVDKLRGNSSLDLTQEVGYLWLLLNRTVKYFMDKHYNWYFVKHEDLCENPINEFSNMFEYLNIPFSDKIKKKIIYLTSRNKVDAENNVAHDFNRNSRLLARYWEDKLTVREIQELRAICENEMLNFYKKW